MAKSDQESRDESSDRIRWHVKLSKVSSRRMKEFKGLRQQRSGTQQPGYYYSRGGTVPKVRFIEPSRSYTFYDNQYQHASTSDSHSARPADYNYDNSFVLPTLPATEDIQGQQALRAQAEAYERAQLEEAIRRSMTESTEAANEYAAANRKQNTIIRSRNSVY